MTQPGQIQLPILRRFINMWWIDILSKEGRAHYNFYAVGNYGQFIYVIPEKNIVIVRQDYNQDMTTGLCLKN